MPSKASQPISFKSFTDMMAALPDDNSCRIYLESIIWKGTPTCPYCSSKKSYELKIKGVFKGQYKCGDCRKRYNVLVNTMFEGTHIPMRKWFIAIYIFSMHKKGISSHQLASDLGITQKSAWFMLGRMRNAFKVNLKTKLKGEIQLDETFYGGKNKNRHADKKVAENQGRSVKDKTPIFGLLNNGSVHTKVVPNTKASTLKPIIVAMVEKGAIIVSDEWGAYNRLNNNFQHEVIKHNEGQYVNDNGFHTNSIEGFWSHLKRGLYGIYHHASPKHLHRYCDEFSFRYNSRKDTNNEKFDFPLSNSTRLTYKQLITKV